MNALERAVRDAWIAWGLYAKFSPCADCELHAYVRARYVSGPFLCVDCFDASRHATRAYAEAERTT
jgi:hypothetical protein